MNNTKSTPLSHLPAQGSAASSPQDIIPADDDSTIQEVLNQLTGGGSSPPPPNNANTQPPPQQPPVMINRPTPPSMPPLDPSTTALLNSLMNSANAVAPASSPPMQAIDTGNSVMNLVMLALTEDFKLATIVFAIFVAIHFVPITSVLGRYFSLEKIPYSEIVIKGAIVAIAVIFAKKMFIK